MSALRDMLLSYGAREQLVDSGVLMLEPFADIAEGRELSPLTMDEFEAQRATFANMLGTTEWKLHATSFDMLLAEGRCSKFIAFNNRATLAVSRLDEGLLNLLAGTIKQACGHSLFAPYQKLFMTRLGDHLTEEEMIKVLGSVQNALFFSILYTMWQVLNDESRAMHQSRPGLGAISRGSFIWQDDTKSIDWNVLIAE